MTEIFLSQMRNFKFNVFNNFLNYIKHKEYLSSLRFFLKKIEQMIQEQRSEHAYYIIIIIRICLFLIFFYMSVGYEIGNVRKIHEQTFFNCK